MSERGVEMNETAEDSNLVLGIAAASRLSLPFDQREQLGANSSTRPCAHKEHL